MSDKEFLIKEKENLFLTEYSEENGKVKIEFQYCPLKKDYPTMKMIEKITNEKFKLKVKEDFFENSSTKTIISTKTIMVEISLE